MANTTDPKKKGGIRSLMGTLKDKLKNSSHFRIAVKKIHVDASDDLPADKPDQKASAPKPAKAPKAPKKEKRKKEKNKNKKKIPLVAIIIVVGVFVLGGAGTGVFLLLKSKDTADARLEKAYALMDSEDYEKAIPAFEKVVEKDSSIVEAYIGLANVGLQLRDPDAVIGTVSAGYQMTSDSEIKEKLLELEILQEDLKTGSDETPGSTDESEPLADGSQEDSSQAEAEPDVAIVTWVDKSFEEMLRVALGKGSTDEIMASELAKVKSLKIVGNTHAVTGKVIPVVNHRTYYAIDNVEYTTNGSIKSLGDLVHFKNLTSLTISYNSINDLRGLEGLTSLTALGLYNNQISDLGPLSGLTNLKWLFLYSNQITDLTPLSGLTGMQELWLTDNNIKDITPLASMTDMRQLFLDDNEISDISVLAGMKNMVFLSADSNHITDITVVSGMTELTDISFKNNSIASYAPASHVQNINKSMYSSGAN